MSSSTTQPYVSFIHTFCTCALIAMLLQFLCSCPLPQIADNIPVFMICLIISYLNALTNLLYLSAMANVSPSLHTCPRINHLVSQQTTVPTLPVTSSIQILSLAYGFMYFIRAWNMNNLVVYTFPISPSSFPCVTIHLYSPVYHYFAAHSASFIFLIAFLLIYFPVLPTTSTNSLLPIYVSLSLLSASASPVYVHLVVYNPKFPKQRPKMRENSK